MNSETISRAALWDEYRRIVLIALTFGAVGAVPVYYFRETKPWLVIAFMGLGFGAICIAEFWGASQEDERATGAFSSDFFLRLGEAAKNDVGELDMFEQMVPGSKDRRRVFRLITDKGDISIVHVSRFMDLLVSRALEDSDKALDHALAVAWHRCGADLTPEVKPVFGKVFREIMKADLRGNLVRLVSQVGNTVAGELSAIAEPPKADAPTAPTTKEASALPPVEVPSPPPENVIMFRLEPLEPGQRPKPKKRAAKR